MTVLLGTMLIFAFAGAEAYAANVIMDENTTQLENGNTYVVGGTVKCSDRINVQEESVVRLNITNKGELNARKGIHVPPGSTLIIGGLGTLTAKGSNECAGIGANYAEDCGEIRIQGGVTVTAEGGVNGAGIGGAYAHKFTGRIHISGGNVTAIGGIDAAGIGSSSSVCEGEIIISGGKVTASCKTNTSRTKTHKEDTAGPGIGAGYGRDLRGVITISGGEVRAVGGPMAAGIGASEMGGAEGATVNISGGRVEAVGKGKAAGIGGGEEYLSTGGAGANVHITGGTVVVNSEHCAIGHGGNDDHMGDLTIADNMMAQVGNNGSNYEKTSAAGNRVNDCRTYKNALIRICDHPEKAYTTDEVKHIQTCQYCFTEFTAAAHDFEELKGSDEEATCEHGGKGLDQECTICSYLKEGEKTPIDPDNHNWGEITYTWSEDNGSVTASRVCRRDPSHIDEETVATDSEVTSTAACEKAEETTYTAKFTREPFETQTKTVETGEALGHQWDEWKEITPASATQEGLERRVCTRESSHVDERPIPRLDHQHALTLVAAQEASCESSGHKAYYECTICKAMYNDAEGKTQVSGKEILIPATGHIEGEPVKGTETAATCSDVGGYNLTTKCETCGRVLRVDHVIFPIDPDAHDWGGWVVTKPATTTEPGVMIRTCGNDPSHEDIKWIPRLNPYRVAAMIDGLKKPYDKAEVQDVYDAYMRLVEGGYSIPDQDLAKLQAAVDYCKLVDMINGLKKPYDKAEVQKTCNAYKRLAGDGYSIPAPELAKLQAAVDSLAKAQNTSLTSVKARKGKKAVVKWKKNINVNGYQLYCKAAGSKAKTVNVNSANTLKKTVKKLKAKKKYTFKIRTFTKVENLSTGKMKTVYGSWSKAKKIKAKK